MLPGNPLRLGLLAFAVAVVPAMADAQTTRSTMPTTSRSLSTSSSLSSASASRGATKNAVFGTIVQVHGSVLTLRLRDGRSETVDASSAIAQGTYSAPLFIGKTILAEGTREPGGIFDAVRISRMTTLDKSSPDR
jgi:hypothetical protein